MRSGLCRTSGPPSLPFPYFPDSRRVQVFNGGDRWHLRRAEACPPLVDHGLRIPLGGVGPIGCSGLAQAEKEHEGCYGCGCGRHGGLTWVLSLIHLAT